MSNPPLDNWDSGSTPPGPYFRFQPNEVYRFTVIVQDPGGVEQARIALPHLLTLLPGHTPVAAQVGSTERHTEVVLFGDRGAPVNSLVVSGSFRAPEHVEPDGLNSPDGIYISAIGRDFGGRSGPPNTGVVILQAGLAPR